MKKVAILQSNYIPWKGYFDIINDVDLFIFYDDVQYTKNDWRNRNLIMTPQGPQWLSIPVGQEINRLVCDVMIPKNSWANKHLKTLQQNYSRAPYYESIRKFIDGIYLGRTWDNLSELNHYLIEKISRQYLGTTTEFSDSLEYQLHGSRQERLLGLLAQVGATSYLSGPAARSYIIEEDFSRAGIELIYKDYSGYPEYPQSYPPFTHNVSILDLLFHTGPDAPWYIWGWRDETNKV